MRRATLVVYLALAAVAAIAAAAARNDESTRDTVVTETGGSFSLANSREGMPVFTAANIGPGDSAKGTVEIANEGSEALAVTLAQRDLSDAPGMGGGLLSQRLSLKITAGPSVIYTGALAAMQSQQLGTLAPGASRKYEFVATLPDGATSAATENAVQGSSTSVTYSWTASEAPPASEAPSASSSTSSTTSRSPSPSPSSPQTPPLSARLVGYRSTLRNGRIVAWVRCNEACRVRSHISFLAPRLPSELPATAHHAQRRRFGARTRRLAVKLPGAALRLLSGVEATARIVVVARSRGGEVTETSALLHLRSR